MSWVTVIWSMTASACLTLGLMYLSIWCRRRLAWSNLMFALMALGTASFAFCEMGMMRAATPAEFGVELRWIHVPAWLVVVSLVGFVRFYLGAGKLWLVWSIIGMRTVALLLNFLLGQNLNYWEITRLQSIPFLGERVVIAQGVSNHWMLLGQASFLLVLIFVVDATLTVWRRGDRRRALVVGGSVVFFVVAAAGESTLVLWQVLRWPVIASLPALATIAAMAYELTRDAQRAVELAGELRESEERMLLATAAAKVGLWKRDLVRNEIWVTNTWRTLFGFDPTEPLSFEKFLHRLHADDRDNIRRASEKAISGDGNYESNFRVVLPDGQIRWTTSRGRVEFDKKRRPVSLRGVTVDITEQKLAEQELAQQRNEVAHLSRVTTLGEISGSLAHELNQPLGAILANTEAAELHLQSATPNLDEVRAILADIRKDDLRAGEIIHGIRAFLRRRELAMQPLKLDQLASEAVKLISADAATRNITIGLEIPPDLPRVLGDRVHLQQVLVNLLVNSMDAVSTCPEPLRRIFIRAAHHAPDRVEIAVSDTGVGIPPVNVGKVFDPFHTTKPGGLGLGLSICRSIVEAHGGAMAIENNLDRGATVRFTLAVDIEAPTP